MCLLSVHALPFDVGDLGLIFHPVHSNVGAILFS